MGQVGGCHERAAELGRAVAAFDMAAEAMHHDLLAVADPEDRHAHLEHPFRGHRRVLPVDAGRAAREDHRLRREGRKEGLIDPVVGVDFAIDVQFAQAARDQLRHLGPEVDDEKAVVCPAHAPD
jgi:hypothetical protein